MTHEITLNLPEGQAAEPDSLIRLAAAELRVAEQRISAVKILKQSIDARRGRIKTVLRCLVFVDQQPPERQTFQPPWKPVSGDKGVIIVGAGPAGLFAALALIEQGIKPVILERGGTTGERKRDIAEISRSQTVNPESNYCFGEGGAGTFSDGKLYTRSNKRGNNRRILEILHCHGADDAILTDTHPHIGSDRLPEIINAVCNTIRSCGGEIHFHCRCTELVIKDGICRGVRAEYRPKDTTGSIVQPITFEGESVILATGHSANDIYELLTELQKDAEAPLLEAKGFAAGIRIEHPRELIDRIQYHGTERTGTLPAASYRLTAQAAGRGVYSFCMCPGGLIVPSATSPTGIVTNGMSPSSRNARWSNAAIVVELRPEDIPDEFKIEPASLAGLRWRIWLETEAAQHGDGQRAPAQRLTDFLDGRLSQDLPPSSYSPGLVSSRLDEWMPEFLTGRLREGLIHFGSLMRGFICPEAVLVGVETRTSTPVRILRDAETLQSPALPGLFPSGEGSGYAGGIMSSALDGERSALAAARYISST